MRIITGQYKGRHFDVPRTFKARPTTDFAKENIFNVLNGYLDFEGISALDLFAGTGSISLEMLSRGCADVTSVELDREHSAFIHQCLQKLGDDRCALIKGDVFRFLKSCRRKYDLISKHIIAGGYIMSSHYEEEKRVAKTMPCRDFEFCAKCEYFGNAIEPLSLKVKKESYSCGKHSRAVVHESIHKQNWNSHRIPVDCPFRTEMKLKEWNGDDAKGMEWR